MSSPKTTQAAEGLPRRAWTVVEIEEMMRSGIIAEDERFELIGGEIVPMSPKGARHEWVKADLLEYFIKAKPARLTLITETTLRLDERSFVEPDFLVLPVELKKDLRSVRGPQVLLAIEVSDSTLHYDLGRKIEIYAAHGVREVWVVNALTLVTRVHFNPLGNGYAEIADFGITQTIAPRLVPELAIRLANLDLPPATETAAP